MRKSGCSRSPVAIFAFAWAVIFFPWNGFSPSYAQASGERVVFSETFEDTLFSSRGWYDYTNPLVTSSAQHSAGSTRSGEFHWTGAGEQTPAQKGARARIEPVEGLTLTFHIKFSDNWAWTGLGWHPHFIMFTTNIDDDYIGPAHTHLTLYVEPVDGKLSFAMQDGLNMDLARLGDNLVGLTENRAVSGGNGDSDGYGGSAYDAGGGSYRNGKSIFADSLLFTENQGPYLKSDWHQIKAHIQLNSIIDGKGVANGVVQFWYDGRLMLDVHDVMMRTGQHAGMKINHLLLLPYFGPGVPHEQTIWIDDISIIQDEQTLPAVDPPVYNPVLIDEKFDNTSFTGRGWYDDPSISLDTLTYSQGVGSSARFTWTAAGQTSPTSRGGRIQFDPVEGFTLSCYTRFSDNWDWPADPTRPQSLFWLATNKDDRFTNPLSTFLTAQINAGNGKLNLILSDYRNIDPAHLGENLVNVTENRAVCGGNGESDSYGGTWIVPSPGTAQNSKTIASKSQYFTNDPGSYSKKDWHQVRVHLQLNSIINGKGIANGLVQYWFDGKAAIDYRNVMFRTGQHPDMKFSQLMLLPYISSGVTQEQSIWIDNLLLVKDEQELRIPVTLNPDVNGDGKISLLDVIAFILKGIRTPDAPELDLNNDGVYNISDKVEMLRNVLRLK